MIDALVCRSGIRSAAIARRPQTADVRPRLRREDKRDGRENLRRYASAAKDDVDECAPRSSVAVDEWMDGLELRVRHRRLDDGRQGII